MLEVEIEMRLACSSFRFFCRHLYCCIDGMTNRNSIYDRANFEVYM